MGLGIESTAFLEHVKTLGVRFDRTAMIGRQNIHTGGYAEDYLRSLGASEVTSFDYSDYEGAEHLHDFNAPIHSEFYNRFSVVLDGGTLEHIFNYPQALANCMKMVEVGGYFITITPTNNYSGHAFYQLSPDAFYQTLTAENGFYIQLVKNGRAATTERGDWSVNGTNYEALLFVVAKKIADVPLFTKPVIQRGCAEMWKGSKTA